VHRGRIAAQDCLGWAVSDATSALDDKGGCLNINCEPRGTDDREQERLSWIGSAKPGGPGRWVVAATFVFFGISLAAKPHSAALGAGQIMAGLIMALDEILAIRGTRWPIRKKVRLVLILLTVFGVVGAELFLRP